MRLVTSIGLATKLFCINFIILQFTLLKPNKESNYKSIYPYYKVNFIVYFVGYFCVCTWKCQKFEKRNDLEVQVAGTFLKSSEQSSSNMSASESRFSTPVRETASARKVDDQTDESISVSDSAYSYRLLEISRLLTAFQPLHECKNIGIE